MHGDTFADQAILADYQLRRAALVFAVLGCCTDNGMVEHCCALAERSNTVHDDMAHQLAVGPYADSRADMAVRSDGDIIAD